jgi:hypothetical protein
MIAMSEDKPRKTKSGAARPTPMDVVRLMNAALETARAEGIAIPPDLERRTFAVTRKIEALTRGRSST